MTNGIAELSQRKIALIAGFSYLIIFITGIFANFIVLRSLIAPGDAAATLNNIVGSELLFRVGIFGFILMVIFDVVVAWALYLVFSPVSRNLSLCAAWFRLVNSAVFGIALFNLFGVLQMISGADYLQAFQTGQVEAQVMLFLDNFNYTWLVGLVFFGIHLLVLGYLIFKSGFIPGIVGILLIIAAFGYLVDSFANFLLPNYTDYQSIFMLIVVAPGIIGELSLTFWLLFRGGKIPEVRLVAE